MGTREERIPDLLARIAGEHGERIGWIDKGRRYTFSEMEAISTRLAGGLLKQGLTCGDRVGIIAPNCIEWLWLFFAATRIGVAVVGLSVRYRDEEIRYMVKDSGLKAVFTVSAYEGYDFSSMFERLAPELPGLESVLDLDGSSFTALLAAEPVPVAPTLRGDDLAMVIYTSGTTGAPKGAALSHTTLLASARAQAAHTRVVANDFTQVASPFNHVGGITCNVLASLVGAACCELVAEFKAGRVIEMMKATPPTILHGVTTMMALLLMHPRIDEVDLSGVRLVITGGSNVEDTLLSRLQKLAPNAILMNLYGMSETSGAIVMTPWGGSDEQLKRCIGRPLDGAEVRVVDDAGRDLPAGQVGELLFRGLGVVRYYIGAAADNRVVNKGGWLSTGDLGELDEDGLISLRGRKKDMFIQGGFNIYPAEVENHIARLEGVRMVAGIGVADEVFGEIGCYYIVTQPGMAVDEETVLEHCRKALADYKVPRRILFRDSLPLTPAGKIRKAALRKGSSEA
jgi:fatty-acyl-CoA synthase